ncbi:hypothetical protein [Sorangium cellulosum]|uniref:hypothetical protein n=1 Tax=Sorangium cellulosum TaxID=56 RepID=UPI001A924FCA|nr:hypothetical protein [Sorangium cellulosum]
MVDVVDPIHYDRRPFVAPRGDVARKSIDMTEGIHPDDGGGDTHAPPRGIEMHALVMGSPLRSPAQRPSRELGLGGRRPVRGPAP